MDYIEALNEIANINFWVRGQTKITRTAPGVWQVCDAPLAHGLCRHSCRAVYYYERSGWYACEEHRPFPCRHIEAVREYEKEAQ